MTLTSPTTVLSNYSTHRGKKNTPVTSNERVTLSHFVCAGVLRRKPIAFKRVEYTVSKIIISQIIAATTEAGMIKLDEKVGGSRKYARYLPFWA